MSSRRLARHSLLLVVLAAVLLAGCRSSDPGSAAPTPFGPGTSPDSAAPLQWDAGGVARLDGLAKKVMASIPDQCDDYGPLDRTTFQTTAEAMHFSIPLSIADCEVLGETVEFSAHRDADARAEFVKERTDILCARAKKGNYDLDGLRWATKDDFAIQVDTEAVGRRLAELFAGEYQPAACPDKPQIDWDPAARAKVEQLAKSFAADPAIACTPFALSDRSTFRKLQDYNGRLPAAYGRCPTPNGKVLYIAAFGPDTIDPAKFAEGEARNLCAVAEVGKGVQGVVGPDFALLSNDPAVVAKVADLSKGTVQPSPCPA